MFLYWLTELIHFNKAWFSRAEGRSNCSNRVGSTSVEATGYSAYMAVRAYGFISVSTMTVQLLSLPEEGNRTFTVQF